MSVFASLAHGYARARPAVHPLVLAQALDLPVQRALDVGSGAGLSTKALGPYARRRVGIEPVHAMAALAPTVDPAAAFCTGIAEALPFARESFGLATAAGSLNYATDLQAALAEIQRVLEPGGSLLVYDFSPGTVDNWFDAFRQRYPMPQSSARFLDPDILRAEATGFTFANAKHYTVEILMDATGYEDYMMTETNVAHAIQTGASEEGIRHWIRSSLAPVFNGHQRNIVIQGYWALFKTP